jgi:aspartate aminotransferase-like enzyme
MEAAIANLLEPGEKIIVGVNGIWGERVADLSQRYQGETAAAVFESVDFQFSGIRGSQQH